MPTYRKKPVEVEAWQWLGLDVCPPDCANAPHWIFEAWQTDSLYTFKGRLMVRTLEGVMEAPVGAWIVRGVRGEIYAVQDGIFQQTYDKVLKYGAAELVISADGEPDEDAAA